MSDPITATDNVRNTQLSHIYNALYNDLSKETGLTSLLESKQKLIKQQTGTFEKIDEAGKEARFNEKCPELAARIKEVEGITESLTKERFIPHLREALGKFKVPLEAVAALDGDERTLNKQEMAVINQIMDFNHPLKVHGLSDSKDGVSAQDVKNAIKDQDIVQAASRGGK